MSEMQQILAGRNELNERVRNAVKPRATEAERQAQATQQELVKENTRIIFSDEKQRQEHEKDRQ